MTNETNTGQPKNAVPAEELAEELSHLLHVVSHDLQEPLRMVTGYLGLIEKRYQEQLDDSGREFIHYAVDGSQRMQQMLQALLKYSRTGRKELDLQAVDMNKLFNSVATELDHKLEPGTWQLDISVLPAVTADPDQLYDTVYHLLDNAIKFRGDKPLQVSCWAEPRGDDKSVVFFVRDNGIGFDQQDAKRVFNVFQRLHQRDEFEGTGIGLSLCKKILQRHGGSIDVVSSPGDGTTFSFTLPAT